MHRNDKYIDRNDFSSYNMLEFICKKEFTVSIFYCTSSALKKYSLHSHDCAEIVCQLEGETRTQIGNLSFTAFPGDILLIPPHTPHKGTSDTGFRDLALRASNIDFPCAAVLHDPSGDITDRMGRRLRTRR